MARNSWVKFMTSDWQRSWAMRSQRARRSSASCRRLHPAIWLTVRALLLAELEDAVADLFGGAESLSEMRERYLDGCAFELDEARGVDLRGAEDVHSSDKPFVADDAHFSGVAVFHRGYDGGHAGR